MGDDIVWKKEHILGPSHKIYIAQGIFSQIVVSHDLAPPQE